LIIKYYPNLFRVYWFISSGDGDGFGVGDGYGDGGCVLEVSTTRDRPFLLPSADKALNFIF